jgi:hypothetical protein
MPLLSRPSRFPRARFAMAAFAGAAMPCSLAAQDLYDTTVLRTINLQFHDVNWMQLLRNNYQPQINILADMTVEGVTYPAVGVRIRGNTSYTALPSGSEKFSLNVEVDFVNAQQTIMGYRNLNLNNGWRDPTFCREVVYNNYVAQFIPNPRANHVVVTLNGQNWGVYANVQQFDKIMLSNWFRDNSGLRIKCANNPNGPGLRYNGALPSGYTGYEIKDTGGLADPWGALIAVCNIITNEPLATWRNIDTLFAIDNAIWSVALENLLTDDDSYINKGADFMTYRDPLDRRTYLLQTDANETFTQATWSIVRNFTATNKPVLNRILAVPELRQRYMAHYRTVAANLNWNYFGPEFTRIRNLIDSAVQADPKKLYSYTLFQNNFTSTVTMPYSGLAGGTMIGLQPFITQRASFLAGNAELMAAAPLITSIETSNVRPAPGETVLITARVQSAGSAISGVDLFYRPTPLTTYQRIAMPAIAPGEYRVALPLNATGGETVAWYVRATAANAYSSCSFLPAGTEWDPMYLQYTFTPSGGMRITEWMYQGANGEFFELTNMSAEAIDMAGWSYDDDHRIPGAFSLSALGIVQPGESVVITESDPAAFRTAWNLGPGVKIIGNLGLAGGNNLSRNDEINLYSAIDTLADRLTYGDQIIPGSPRAQGRSGQTCRDNLGQNDAAAWSLSFVGDAFGSFISAGGDRGTPGAYIAPSCNPCYANCDESTVAPVLNVDDFTCFINQFALAQGLTHAQQVAHYANCDGSTAAPALNVDDFTCFINQYAQGCP